MDLAQIVLSIRNKDWKRAQSLVELEVLKCLKQELPIAINRGAKELQSRIRKRAKELKNNLNNTISKRLQELEGQRENKQASLKERSQRLRVG